jgi:hypothetical protein
MVDAFLHTVFALQSWGSNGHLYSFIPPCPELKRHVYHQRLASQTEMSDVRLNRGDIHPTGVSKSRTAKSLTHSPNSLWRQWDTTKEPKQ